MRDERERAGLTTTDIGKYNNVNNDLRKISGGKDAVEKPIGISSARLLARGLCGGIAYIFISLFF
jgi:hypothetical protein